MIYVTGDTHIPIDIGKLAEDRFVEQFLMTKEDYLIICGDFGGVWSESLTELKWRDWLDHRSFTTLFVDGNHENFDLLSSYPLEHWNGGKVHHIGQSIYHLMRGQVFTLQGQTFFTLGGGLSIDRANRTPGLSWWPQEMPSAQEYDEAWANLERYGFSVDYVITHAAPETFMRQLFPAFRYPGEEELTEFLDKVRAKASYRHWYFGHLHEDRQMDDRHTALYDNIVKLPIGEDGQGNAVSSSNKKSPYTHRLKLFGLYDHSGTEENFNKAVSAYNEVFLHGGPTSEDLYFFVCLYGLHSRRDLVIDTT